MKTSHAPVDEAALALARKREHVTARNLVEAGITTHPVVARRSLRRLHSRGLMRRSDVPMLCGKDRNMSRRVAIYTLVSSQTAATPASQRDQKLLDFLRKHGVASTAEIQAGTGINLNALWSILKRLRKTGVISGKRDGLDSLHWLKEGA